MRKFSKISGMHIVSCDHSYALRYPGEGTCGEQFRTCSDKSVVPKQLEAAGWTLRDMLDASSGVTEKFDLCPHHSQIVNKQQSTVARYQQTKRDG